jgi:hypothetical protein
MKKKEGNNQVEGQAVQTKLREHLIRKDVIR